MLRVDCKGIYKPVDVGFMGDGPEDRDMKLKHMTCLQAESVLSPNMGKYAGPKYLMLYLSNGTRPEYKYNARFK